MIRFQSNYAAVRKWKDR